MRHGWYLKYGTKFRGGKEKFYIKKGYEIGILHFLAESILLDIEDAQNIAKLIQERKEEENHLPVRN